MPDAESSEIAAPAPAPAPRLRVITMNVYGPANPDWERRHVLIARTLRELDPDVVALQEVPTGPALSTILDPSYHTTHFSRSSEDGVGGTLATRWAHQLVTEIDQHVSERSRDVLPWTATTVVELTTPLGPLVVAHHKPSWPFPYELEREQQAVRAARTLEEHIGTREVHAVVLGDFDATPDSASMLFWRGRRAVDGLSVCYQDAWESVHPGEPGYTFEMANPLVYAGEVSTAVTRKIDHVLVRSGLHGPTLRVDDCRRVLDSPVGGVWASDHYGVMADLVLPDQPPGFRS
jgi:endonuclease/exonuclease/phosphatase family metal-dependent hydrolase